MLSCSASPDCPFADGHTDPCVVPVVDGFGWVPMPSEPWNEILDGLHQGGSWVTPTEAEFDAVLTLYASAQPISGRLEQRHWPILDAGMPDESELTAAMRWVHAQWWAGRRVLVRCQAGLNRSGLVVARTLIETGVEPGEAIRLIRAKRSGYALCNPRFEAYLRAMTKLADSEPQP
ncbi:dual specificity protein phosphatase family protein [Microbispora sp. H11081]|uniref:protein-tyrosine phosphatase family protein n=1 Tax=Microbispora sp. H11081 TaxID=2729107 RepID=UPI001B8CBB9A|nr:dual specificity protein phosphatase family protein [Microbispora sp. H11081]